MITHIRVKNFKSWADSGEVQLAPLTGFFGTNSSGKSSLLQMLLLQKQSIGSDDILFFGDEHSLVNLGSFGDVIHGHDTDETLTLEYGCKPQAPVATEVDRQMPDGTTKQLPVPVRHFAFNLSVRGSTHHFSVESFRYGFNSREVPDIQWQDNRLSRIDWRGEEKRREIEIMSPSETSVFNHDVLRPLTSAFAHQFSHVYYLGPTRVHPQRHYHWNGEHPVEMGLCGDEAIAALLSARVRQLKTCHNGNGVPIEARVSAWLQKMELAHDFWLGLNGASDNSTYEVRIQKTSTSARVTLADIGYGLADLLPILVHCYYVPEGSTLILEQPGIHLHPQAQAQLADLFLEVIAERHLQILIESHSEQLLTRLQRRIAEKKVAQDTIALYFCRNTDGASTIEKLEVDELGDIHNWPEYFFGNVMGDMFAMTDVQVERMTVEDLRD